MQVYMAMALAAVAQGWSTKLPDNAIAGPRSEVMVLGTPHLSGLPREKVSPEQLSPLLDRLAAWKPHAIAIENLSGAQCDQLRRYPTRFGETAEQYCPDPSIAAKATGLDVPAATAAADKLLADWPAKPSPAQRRQLAALWLAAGEETSALVQWLRLPVAERQADAQLTAPLVALLEKRRASRNESDMLAAALAARLGHERVYPVDDHTSDAVTAFADARFEAAMRRIWSGPTIDRRKAEDEKMQAGLGTPAGLLAMYRHYNQPGLAKIVFDSDFGRAIADRTPEAYGRQYAGWWETRNLRMVANIREVLARQPGMRLLAVVGASHKPYYEAYLAPMHDVRVADVGPTLK